MPHMPHPMEEPPPNDGLPSPSLSISSFTPPVGRNILTAALIFAFDIQTDLFGVLRTLPLQFPCDGSESLPVKGSVLFWPAHRRVCTPPRC